MAQRCRDRPAFTGGLLLLCAAFTGLALVATTSSGEAATAGSGATRFVAGFSADTPARVAEASSIGVTTDILYNGPPPPRSPLRRALVDDHMSVVDARLSGELFYWECHRTHTVAPPPAGQPNDYCATDEDPSVDSPAVVLKTIDGWLRQDAADPLVRGYWILDDWPYWDGGSARGLLQEVHQEIEAATPGYPAICGFGGTVLRTRGGFDLSTAKNYSNGGCDMVGWYNYAPIDVLTHPSTGSKLDWSMTTLLGIEGRDLARFGWSESNAPLLGIGQAWSGPYDEHYYQPGLTVAEMQTQAAAFCAYGASAIGWYAWDDSGYGRHTDTPDNSQVIDQGIEAGEAACGFRP